MSIHGFMLLIVGLIAHIAFRHVTVTGSNVPTKCRTTPESCSSLNLREEMDMLMVSFVKIPGCRVSMNPNHSLNISCSNGSISEIPNNIPNDTIKLLLTKNNIKHVPKDVFKHLSNLRNLDISYNVIETLNDRSFYGLEALHTLNLAHNMIRYTQTAIPPNVFVPLVNLTILHLEQGLEIFNSSGSLPIWALHRLSKLEELSMDGLDLSDEAVIHQNFSHLKSLWKLEFNGTCFLPSIRRNMFKNISQIKHLTISRCSVQKADNLSFAELTNLQHLDISKNTLLNFKHLRNISYGLQSTKIKYLDMSAVTHKIGYCTRLCRADLTPLYNTTLKRLILDGNRLAGIDIDAFPFLPPSIEMLSLRRNQIIAMIFIGLALHGSKFPNMKQLFISNQNQNPMQLFLKALNDQELEYFPQEESGCDEEDMAEDKYNADSNSILTLPTYRCSNCDGVGFIIPPAVEHIDLSDSRVRLELNKMCLCQPNSLKKLDLNRNNYWKFTGSFRGLDNLTHLDLSWNFCQEMTSGVLQDLVNLQHLNLSRNLLAYSLQNDNGRLFRNQKKLKSLDISDNRLTKLQRQIFSNLSSLTCLFLNDNQLTHITFDFSHMTCLQYLDISGNAIHTLDPPTTRQFDALYNVAILANRAVFVDLSNNNISCRCRDAAFVTWLSHTAITIIHRSSYKCEHENGTTIDMTHIKTISEDLSYMCKEYIMLIAPASVIISIFLIVIAVAIVYRYRWDIRYMYYSSKIKYRRYQRQSANELFRYDAFVSYSESESAFVKGELIPALEEERGIKLLVHERDFLAGNYVAENVMNAIMSSRKTLIVMSKGFLESNWCIYEMNMARVEGIQTGRNLLCILMKEQIHVALKDLPLEVVDLIRQKTYLGLPDDVANMERFWNRLADSIKEL